MTTVQRAFTAEQVDEGGMHDQDLVVLRRS